MASLRRPTLIAAALLTLAGCTVPGATAGERVLHFWLPPSCPDGHEECHVETEFDLQNVEPEVSFDRSQNEDGPTVVSCTCSFPAPDPLPDPCAPDKILWGWAPTDTPFDGAPSGEVTTHGTDPVSVVVTSVREETMDGGDFADDEELQELCEATCSNLPGTVTRTAVCCDPVDDDEPVGDVGDGGAASDTGWEPDPDLGGAGNQPDLGS